MKFLFLAKFSPDVKIVSQIYREKTNQNNERSRVKTLLVEVTTFLLGNMANWVPSSARDGHSLIQHAEKQCDYVV